VGWVTVLSEGERVEEMVGRFDIVELREREGGGFSRPTGTIREPNSTPMVTS